MALGFSDPELRDNTAVSVLKLFLRVQKETKLQYLDIYGQSPEAVKSLLTRFCDPTSPDFSPDVSDLCTKKAIECLAAILPAATDEQILLSALRFLRKLTTTGSLFPGGSGSHYHLFVLLPVFADLVLHISADVRKQLRKIMLVIAAGP
jgi:hypothetical protein